MDPSGFSAGDANLYRYVGNNVLNATDPSGLMAYDVGYRVTIEQVIAYLSKPENLNQLKIPHVGGRISPAALGTTGVQGAGLGLSFYMGVGFYGAILAEAMTQGPHNPHGIPPSGTGAIQRIPAVREALFGEKQQFRPSSQVMQMAALAVKLGIHPGDVAGVIKQSRLIVASTTDDKINGYILRDLSRLIMARERVIGQIVLAKELGLSDDQIKATKSEAELNKLIKPRLLILYQKLEAARRRGACFAAGTLLYTPTGYKPIESFRVGDALFSRSEDDPTSDVAVKRVEEVFVHTGRIWVLTVNGREIRTTDEHPFWVRDRGWVNACELVPGDQLSSHDGQWVVVESVVDTGKYERVYNLRIADYHTYFVGCDEWGFSVWAHNACIYHYGLPGKTVLEKGSWVTDKRHLNYASAIAITFLDNPDAIGEYTIDLDLFPPGIVNWVLGLVSGGHQGRLAIPLTVPPVVQTNVYNKP